jgi:hypothetical protein
MNNTYKTLTVIALLLTLLLNGIIVSCKSDPERTEKPFTSSKQADTISKTPVNQVKKDTLYTTQINIKYSYSKQKKLQIPASGKLEKGHIDFKKGVKFKKNDLLCFINTEKPFLKLREAKLAFITQFESICINQTQNDSIKLKATRTFFNKLQKPTKLPDLVELTSFNQEQEQKIKENYIVLENIEKQIQTHFYLAPFNGELVKINKDINQNILGNETIAYFIPDNDLITLSFEAPDSLFETGHKNTIFIGNVSIPLYPKNIINNKNGINYITIPGLKRELIPSIKSKGGILKTEKGAPL